MKVTDRDICQLLRDTCLFTLRDMGYLVPLKQPSIFNVLCTVFKIIMSKD